MPTLTEPLDNISSHQADLMKDKLIRSELVSKCRHEKKFYLRNNWRLSYTIPIVLPSSTFSVLVQTALYHTPLFCNSSALLTHCNQNPIVLPIVNMYI